MESYEAMERYQELLRKFDRNSEDRLELENERNEILNQKSVAVREKWLRQLGKCARGNNRLEQKFATESIQETIDLCHQHLQGLENDLTRLEDNRKKLLLELEDLKSKSNCDFTTTDINNNVKKPVPRIIITTNSSLGKRRRKSSKDEPLSPTGLERRYELQRKIDEELRKLQLAENMAQDQATENLQMSSGVTLQDTSFDLKNDMYQQSHQPVECDKEVNVNGLQLDNVTNINEDDKSPTIDTCALIIISQNEMEHQHAGTHQIGDVKEFHKDKSDSGENHEHVTVVAKDRDSDITDGAPTQEVESDSIPYSSTVTSYITTATTSTLLQQANSTTHNNDEPLPSDEIVSELSQNMEKVTIEQTESSENTAIDETPLTDFNAEEASERDQDSDVVQGTSVDPESHAALKDVKVTSDIEVNMPVEVEDQPTSSEKLVDSEQHATTSLLDANQQERLLENHSISKDELVEVEQNVSASLLDINQQESLVEVKDQSIRKEELVEVEQIPAAILIDTDQHGELNEAVNINVVTNLSEEVVNTPPPSPVKSFADVEASESELGTTESSQTMEDKASSDDEDYSGCDIDMGGASSYREQISVAEDIHLANYEVTEACDDDNNPIFVDVKYSVGEQINIVSHDNDVLDMPSPTIGIPDEASAPWDSSGQILENTASATNESIPSNKADSDSRSAHSSISDDDVHTKAVAEQTVSNAIHAAYEIYAAKQDNHSDPDTNEVTDNSDTQDSTHDIEKREDAITVDYTSVGINAAESSLSYSGYDGVESDSSKLVITTSHHQDGHSGQRTDADAENGESGSRHDETEDNIEQSSSAVINGDQISSDLSPADSPPATKDLSQTSDIIEKVIEDTVTTPGTVNVTDTATESQDTSEHDANIVEEEKSTASNDMTNEQEQTTIRNAPDKITYNPAFSQRNTEAAKWFGQPTSENKIWMKPSGRPDASAEMERKRLIKAMTRRNNPNLVPKWEPPKVKDFTEDLDEKHKESLKKYEERRRDRTTTPGFKEGASETELVPAEESAASTKELPRENIVVESVVHSRDAISIWESRLSEKQHKEKLEKQRLSVGKLNKGRPRATSEIVTSAQDSLPTTTISTDAALPSSEHIERESVDISKVRNRWKDMDKCNKVKQPEPAAKKPQSSRKSTFTVNAAPAFRSSQSPSTAIHQQDNSNVVNARTSRTVIVSSSKTKESQIDREIREAAEREEKWKQEQWEKMSEISTVSSEDVFPDRNAKTNGESAIDQLKEIDNVQPHASSPADSQNQPNGQKEADSESLSSYGSGTGNVLSSPPYTLSDNAEKSDAVSRSSNQEGVDSGIDECNNTTVHVAASKSANDNTLSDTAPLSQDVKTTVTVNKTEEQATFRRKRISSLTHAVTPRGWEPNKTRITPVSPVSPMQRSFSRAEIQEVPTSPLQPVQEIPKVEADLSHVSSHEREIPSMTAQVHPPEKFDETLTTTEKQIENRNVTKPTEIPANGNEFAAKPAETKKGGPIFIRKSGGPVGVSSSKSQLQTIMAREMEDAAAREAEWRKKQLELVNKGVDLSAHSVVHSTREIRTPVGHSVPPPVNSAEQSSDVNLRRPVKSLFADDEDENAVTINVDAHDEYKKREVVKAMRVQKRKSLLAMRWEEGQFQNTGPDDDENQ